MIINTGNMEIAFKGFSTAFTKGFTSAPSNYRDVAMVVPSSARDNTYGWLGQLPKLREWLGDRVIQNVNSRAIVTP